MLEFTRHPHLPLATVALSFWGSLVREAGAVPGPNKASPMQSPREEGAVLVAGGAAAAAGAATAGAAAVDKSQLIPPECCQVRALAGALRADVDREHLCLCFA
jgi:hypothetical protein